MKKIFSLFLVAFATCFYQTNLFALEPISIPIESSDVDKKDKPDTGHRAPSRKTFCIIDYNQRSVILTPSTDEEFESFEIWTNDFTLCVGIYNNIEDFLGHLSQLSEATIVLHTESKSYSGYYSN